jgi:hypothetical protein
MIGVVGGAHAENALKVFLIAHMSPPVDENRMFENGGNGMLSSFSNKIAIAHAFGLIGQKTRDDLDNIRIIRNAFAHAVDQIDFSQEDIAKACVALYHIEPVTLSMALTGPKSYFVRAVLNITRAMRKRIETRDLGLLTSRFFPHESLP